MSESEEGKVIAGGLVVSMRPQISVELLEDGDILIDTATVDDAFEKVAIDQVRFPSECARAVADELYRLADLADANNGGKR